MQDEGLVPLVWFDANAGYLTAGQYLRADQLSRMLGLKRGQVAVAPKGVPADRWGEGGVRAMVRASTHPTLAANSAHHRMRGGRRPGSLRVGRDW